jgi:hypothetical protein
VGRLKAEEGEEKGGCTGEAFADKTLGVAAHKLERSRGGRVEVPVGKGQEDDHVAAAGRGGPEGEREIARRHASRLYALAPDITENGC